jgi:molybdopterin/thiamine biosynthesis adenylyltransferase
MTVLTLRPGLHELVSPEESRTLRQLEVLGVDTADEPKGSVVSIEVSPEASPARRLLARATLDYVLRLDPLVTEVRVDGFEETELAELAERVPYEHVTAGDEAASYTVSIGAPVGGADLVADGHGWLAAIGNVLEQPAEEMLNPVGPLAAAALAAGEVFKAVFALSYPDAPLTRRFVGATGTFSCFDYSFDGANPPIELFTIDAFLVGLGGVGAAAVRTLGELGANVRGRLRLVDADKLSTDNLNRVLYARWRAAVEKDRKVDEAKLYLDARLPNVDISRHRETFEEFKRELAPRRQDRRFDVVITGLDNDEARHEVQRDLPRVLIDGATGRDTNLTVERSVIGEWGCLGCTRQMDAPVDPDANCDDPPDDRAPSLSFVSGLAGTLAAAELIKEATAPEAALRGSFDHIFIYGLNPDLVSEPAFSPTCRIDCQDPARLRAYNEKYPIG